MAPQFWRAPAAPFATVGNPGYYRFCLGSHEVTALSDGALPLPMTEIYQNAPEPEMERRLRENFLGPDPHVSINAYLINDGTQLILIDAGTGTLFGPAAGKLLRHFEASGYRAEQVDHVILTHIHADHSGGLTVEGQAQFPNAKVHVPARDIAYWIERKGVASLSAERQVEFDQAQQALAPYLAVGQVTAFADNAAPLPGFGSILRSGHTPGHSSIVLKTEAQVLVFWGDIIHGDYIQFDTPDIAVSFDVDPAAAVPSREIALGEAADQGYLVAGAHLPFPGIGQVARDDTLYRWVRMNYRE